jgi:hypothetical protein
VPKESSRTVDRNGWLEVRDNPISKVGVFDYLGREIKREPGQPPLEPDKIYQVLRPAEELARDETINSFKLLPFVDDHTVLGIDGIPAEAKGIHGTIGEQVYFDAPYLRGNIKVHSNTALSLINAGKVELSPAYYCDWPEEGGTYDGQPYQFTQRNIIGNHLALVKEGRTGADVAVQDSKVVQDSNIVVNDRNMTITLDSAELLPMEFTPEQLAQLEAMIKTIVANAMGAQTAGDADPVKDPAADADPVVDPTLPAEPVVTAGQEDAAQETVAAASEAETALQDAADALAEVSAAAEQVVATDSKDKVKLQAAKTKLAAAKVKSAQKQKIATDSMAALKALRNKGSIAADQAVIKELREKVARLESGASVAMDSAKFMGEIADRNELASKLSHFTGNFDHSRMTLDGVAEYGIKKLGLTAPKGSERIALDAWMHGRKPAHEQIITADSAKAPSLDEAWAKQAEGK